MEAARLNKNNGQSNDQVTSDTAEKSKITDFQKITTANELDTIYGRRFDTITNYRNAVWQILCRDFFSHFIKPHHTVLDLGCGYGEFINNIEAQKKFAMDLNPNMPSRLRPDIECLLQDCSKPWPITDKSLDVVFSSNFFEHLPDKFTLNQTLQHAHQALKPGGILIALGPNIRYLNGQYWDFYDHYLPLSDLSMAEGLEINGFKVTKRLDRFLPYTMAEKQPPLVFLKTYLRLPMIWSWFGKQFLVVGRV
jgi:SAM-dependent methyltransferase